MSERAAFHVCLDERTIAWLMELADICHAPPGVVIASILRDVCEDDIRAHGQEAVGVH